MSVKTYNTGFGIFTVVADSDIFNNITSENKLDLFPWSSIKMSIAIGASEYSAYAYVHLTALIPAVYLKLLMPAATSQATAEENYYTLSDNSDIYTTAFYVNDPADLRFRAKMRYMTTELTYTGSSLLPYGVFGTSVVGSDTPNYIVAQVLLCNDDMTEFKWSEVTATDSDYSVSDFSAFDETQNAILASIFAGATPIVETDDPYADGGNSSTSNSAGTFANTGSNVGAPDVASMDPSASGFMTAFNPDGTQMQAFAQWLWNTLDVTALQQIYSSPMEAVIGLLAVPVSPTVGSSATINLGNVATSVSAPVITNRFKKISMGTVTIPEWWGAYLDYEPYTQVSIFLPYIGVQQLDTNDVMGKAVTVYYYVDVISGACLAILECDGKALYHFPGQCGVQIPVTASSFGNVLQSALSVASSALQSIASQASGNFQSVSEVATSVFSGAKTRTQRSGQVGSAAGFMDNQTPFFIVQRPVQCKPENQNMFTGYPAFITYTLSDLIGTGYTEVAEVRLTNVPALADELTELEAVLKSGVIL